jgi:hypothetical protein
MIGSPLSPLMFNPLSAKSRNEMSVFSRLFHSPGKLPESILREALPWADGIRHGFGIAHRIEELKRVKNAIYCLVPLILCLSLTSFAQTKYEIRPLVSGQPVEREMLGGEAHTYQVTLQAGQFMRVMVEQKGIDVAVALVAPDQKHRIEANIFSSGQESLSYETAVSGDYQIVVRAVAAKAPKGMYEVQLELKAAATAPDKQRIAAERMLQEEQAGAVRTKLHLQYAGPTLSITRRVEFA